MKKAIFLYSRTVFMAKPWLDAGYECWLFDGQHEPGITREGNLIKVGMWFDARKVEQHAKDIKELVGDDVEFVFGFAECTYLSCSGSGWLYHPEDKHLPTNQRRPHPLHKNRKSQRAEAVELAKMVNVVGDEFGCKWGCENPISTLATLWRKPDFYFDPCDFAGYLPDNDVHPEHPNVYPGRDRYNKKTCIWCGNGFIEPRKKRIEPEDKDNPGWKKLGGKSQQTKNIRSSTPRGFAVAVFEANSIANS